MTAVPPDPDPRRVPGLEPGGSVAPGDTPPDSAQTSGLGEPEPRPRHKLTPTAVVSMITLAVFIAVFAAAAIFLLIDMSN